MTLGFPKFIPSDGATFFKELMNSLVTASSLHYTIREIQEIIFTTTKYRGLLAVVDDGPLGAADHRVLLPVPETTSPVSVLHLVRGCGVPTANDRLRLQDPRSRQCQLNQSYVSHAKLIITWI